MKIMWKSKEFYKRWKFFHKNKKNSSKSFAKELKILRPFQFNYKKREKAMDKSAIDKSVKKLLTRIVSRFSTYYLHFIYKHEGGFYIIKGQ